MTLRRALASAICAIAIALLPPAALASHAATKPVARASNASAQIPRYQHIFVVVMENHNYAQIIGNVHAPYINELAQQYALATHYDGVTHPSEPNYVALIGGNYFGIQNDGPYTTNIVQAPSLADQLTAAGLTWKAYQQSLPYAGYLGTTYPTNDPLYASKHNPFLNFAGIQRASTAQLAQEIVPDTQLATDLAANRAPTFSFITPDLCHDMHGGATACPYADNADNPNDANDIALVSTGDEYVRSIVGAIVGSRTWQGGNDAIVVVWDENDNFDNPNSAESYEGCCDAVPGGGRVPAIVITNHHSGRRAIKDATPYNHYALLRTIQAAFGLGCLAYTCDTANVPIMTPLFAAGRR